MEYWFPHKLKELGVSGRELFRYIKKFRHSKNVQEILNFIEKSLDQGKIDYDKVAHIDVLLHPRLHPADQMFIKNMVTLLEHK